MRGARRVQHGQSMAAWLVLVAVVVFFLLLLLLAVSRGEALRSSPTSGGGGGGGGEAVEQELNRLGSRPPCCDRKCGGCAPCTAVLRVRAAAAAARPQCSNYEPLGWKCKCRGAFFDP